MQDRASLQDGGLARDRMDPLLKIADLSVHYRSRGGEESWALRGVGCVVNAGEAVGILGESGGGKSTLAHAVLGVLPDAARCEGGSIQFKGRELLGIPEAEMRLIRGAQISLVPQDPATALNPVRRVGKQIADVVASHHDWSARRCRSVAEETLGEVGLRDIARIYSAYPHQLSGGQRQRVAIAQALACRPALLIADEPTSLLDTTVQSEILSLLMRLRVTFGLTTLFISHNPAVLAEVTDRILVFYAGQVLEDGSSQDVLNSPLHPYTQALLRCLPRAPGALSEFKSIGGDPPDLRTPPLGCAFEPRCRERMEECAAHAPQDVSPAPARRVRCFKFGG